MKNNLASSAELHYTLSVFRDGKEIKRLPKSKNLILDSGLDKIGTASNFWAVAFEYMLLGVQASPTPVRRDSGAITLSQSGTTITASSSFFVASDTGRLLKYNDIDGTEVYLTYVSATQATASVSKSVSSVNGTIWYVNQTALESFSNAANTYSTDGGANGTTWSSGTQTLKRTIIGRSEPSDITYTEIGFNSTSSNSNIFDRDVITGGLSLLAGDQVRCTVQVIVTWSPITPASISNVGTGLDTTGNAQLESGLRLPYVASAGYSQGEIGPTSSYIAVLSNGASFVTFSTSTESSSNAYYNKASTVSSYTNGTFYRSHSAVIDVNNANTTLCGFSLGYGGSRSFTTIFNSTFTKTSAQTLSITFRWVWGRTLTN